MSWFGDDLKLPQDDSSSQRQEGLKKAREEYVSDEHKLNLNGFTMAYENPDKPDLTWVGSLLEIIAGIALNTEEVHRKELADSDREHAHAKRSERIGGASSPAAGAFTELLALVMEGDWAPADERPSSIDDYDVLYQHFDMPEFARGQGMDRPCFTDKFFADYRLNGPNSPWIKRTTGALPDDYAKIEAFGALSRDPSSFGDAVANGEVFVADYSLLLGIAPVPGGFMPPAEPSLATNQPVALPKLSLRTEDPAAWQAQREEWIERVYKPFRAEYDQRDASGYDACSARKALSAPVGVFQLNEDGTGLDVVGIQVAPATGGAEPRIYAPGDGWAWQQAKTHLQVADGNTLQAISHLAETHVVMEVACLATHVCLAPQHPLNHLLVPHFYGTLLINGAADSSLVAAHNGVDIVMAGTIGTSVRAVRAGFDAYDFNAKMLPNQLAARGFADDATQALRYSYRDDGLSIWRALHTWVSGYIEHYYKSDAEVGADRELAALGLRLNKELSGVGDVGDGRVKTRAYLTDMVTHLIFTGSAQHAAVNFPQFDLMAYPPNQPLAAMAFRKEDVTEQDFLACMPPMQAAEMQLSLGRLLGGLRHTELGKYPTKLLGIGDYFHPKEVQQLNKALLRSLGQIEANIDVRLQAGIDNYYYLKPSLVPRSINI
jgi:hypothetical protein